MNREILFRAKEPEPRHTSDGWVTGFYCTKDGAHFITAVGTYASGKSYFSDILVDLNTVGQFTGLTDNYGKKIFEGDIVEINHIALKGAKGVVTFRCGSFYLHAVSNALSLYAFLPWCKVIGNIHDNPELMEGIT